jgi:hypothetical protein
VVFFNKAEATVTSAFYLGFFGRNVPRPANAG